MHTNGRMDEMAKSLMIQFSQVQRLKRKCPPKKVDPKKSNSGLFEVDDHTYVAMLEYYQQKDSTWYDYQSLDLPEGAKVLTPYAREVQSMEVGAVRFNWGNGKKVVEYIKNRVQTWGIVTHCLKVQSVDECQIVASVRLLSGY
ncbi:hypothetical protein CROQUDRAFT_686045 [Cronartium quercuum f. sp. fusiforme G11]|uniref:Uncharacterized protein n=1 Tax=Cronartium quercuum f. sp. fusiforme G11 TaxID=708437 RepID=A0A9P6NBN4_9BASI|nr:hypothetical protein CROQUDRAFT_686045 [Cronartium quercuum f. sp. fusiforme G11]